MTTSDFFFCYNKEVADYLRYEKGITYITTAKHVKTDNTFWMFLRTPELDKALDEK